MPNRDASTLLDLLKTHLSPKDVQILNAYQAEHRRLDGDVRLLKGLLVDFGGTLKADIPLSPPDPAFDPNDQFRAAARDRSRLYDSFVENALWLVNPGTKLPAAHWSYYLGITVIDPDGWDRKNYDESWSEKITRSEFLRRAAVSTTKKQRWGMQDVTR